jgi:Protein of unknown function (DUF3429)
MLRRAAQSLRQACSSHTAAAWKVLETNTAIKNIHTKPFLRQAAEETSSSSTAGAAGAVGRNAASASASVKTAPQPSQQQPQGLAAVPNLIKALGFGGIIPFWAFSPAVAPHLPFLDLLGDTVIQNAGLLQVGYGATIISFLGGVHWGLAMTSLTPMKLTGQRYVWSVMPCLTAWPTLAMPVQHAAAMQSVLLGFVYLVDRGWFKKGGLPPWYMAMRLPLTVGAVAGLAMTAVAAES